MHMFANAVKHIHEQVHHRSLVAIYCVSSCPNNINMDD